MLVHLCRLVLLLLHLLLLLGPLVLAGEVAGKGFGVALHQGDGTLAKDALEEGEDHLQQRLIRYWSTIDP